MKSLILLGTALLATSCLSNPLARNKRASCTLSGSSLSDLPSIKSSCNSITIENFEVPAGETLDLTDLQSGTTVTFKGTTTFGYKEWTGPLLSVSGTNLRIVGASGSKLDGQGSLYWDKKGGNGGKKKPKFFKANNLYDSVIENINIYESPVHVFSVNTVKNVTVNNILIDDSNGDTGGGHNTDAFDVGNAEQVVIKNSKVYNQDDCLAINSGIDIQFENNYCKGGHGISIGSVGGRDNNVVKGVVIKNSEIVDSDNGIRIKTVFEQTGLVSDITFENVTLTDIHKYGITIRGDYTNGGSKGTPTDGVPIEHLTVKNIHGTVDSKATQIFILVKGASDWNWSDIDIEGGKHSKKCEGIPSDAGIEC